MTHLRTTTLSAARPFSFDHSLSFLCSFPPTAGEQAIGRRSLGKAMALEGAAVLTTVRETEGGALSLEVASDRAISDAVMTRATERVRFQLSLDDDLASFYAWASDDAAFAPRVQRFFGHHHVKFPSAFEIAIWAVLAQRNMRMGRRIKDAIVDALGPRVTIDGITHRAFPEPHAMTDRAALRTIVKDDAKADAMSTIARAFAREDLAATLLALPYDQAAALLESFPRLGPWSSAFVLFRGLGRMERLAVQSGPILAAAAEVYGTTDEKRLRAIGDGYGAWCGYWSLYLRRS
jgi:3-methyladenine DNA glycosylase/8-oxoguanine DNA glycosylase